MRGVPRQAWLLPGAVLVLALVAWVLTHAYTPAFRVEPAPASPGASAAAADRAPSDAAAAPPAGGAPGAPSGSLADLLEAQAGELSDILAQMHAACAAAQAPAPGGGLARAAASGCVADAEAAMSIVDLLRGTVESPAGQNMPGEVRARWATTLAQATAAIREALAPLWTRTGQVLASGQAPPEEVRRVGHLRDRIGRVLSEAERPPGR
jgi:hypothetical protein